MGLQGYYEDFAHHYHQDHEYDSDGSLLRASRSSSTHSNGSPIPLSPAVPLNDDAPAVDTLKAVYANAD